MSHLLIFSNTIVHRNDSGMCSESSANNRKNDTSSCKTYKRIESHRNKQVGINLLSAALVAISIFVIQLNVVTRANEEHGPHWTYMDQKAWNETYPQCVKNGHRQSPINIITNRVIPAPLNITLINYDQEVEFKIKNTHHSVSMMPVAKGPEMTPHVKLNWLNDSSEHEFELNDIHFHWGDHDKKGSEHLLDGERFEAEMHMVHYRKGVDHSQVGSIPNSLLVIGVFIKSEPSDNNKFSGVVWGTQKVNGTDELYTTENNDIRNLLPNNIKDFYTYQGSLTTPPCYEIVTWVVMADPVYMGRNQLSELADLYADEHDQGMKRIAPNFREVNQLSGRKVYSSMFGNITDNTIDGHDGTNPQSDNNNSTNPNKTYTQINIQRIDGKKLSQVLNQLGRQASTYGRRNGRGRNRSRRRRS